MFRFKLFAFALLLFGMMAACAPAQPVATPTPEPLSPAGQAVQWLVTTHQNEDGGYTAFSSGANQAPSSVAGSVDALLALAAGGGDVTPVLAYLQANPEGVVAYAAESGGNAGKLLWALTAVSQNPRDFQGINLLVPLTEPVAPTGELNSTTAYNQALALLGLSAAEGEIPPASVAWLMGLQAENGSWDDGFGTAENNDSTALAIMALHRLGVEAEGVNTAVAFLRTSQNDDGGWGYATGMPSNPNSTALVIQALRALGEDVQSANSPWAKNGVAPLTALLSFQSASGAFQADFGDGPFDDFYATVQTLPALAEE
jgi:hypothetical protein